jgi:RHS repeat-associated protein
MRGPLLLQIGYNILIFSQATNRQCCTEERDVLDTCIFDSTGGSGKDITENRHLQINYPGTGNNSQFTYDGYGQIVQIVESISGTVSNAKQFVCTDEQKWESRDSSGNVQSRYFTYGQTLSGSNYYFTRDHLTSVREFTDSLGTLQAAYNYDLYGRASRIQGSLAADFQYADYYFHPSSGLSLPTFRAYNANLGRFINRDPLQEIGGINLYKYVNNNPEKWIDPSGRQYAPPISPPTIGWDIVVGVGFLGLYLLSKAGISSSSGSGSGSGSSGDTQCNQPCVPPRTKDWTRQKCEQWCINNCKPTQRANCALNCQDYHKPGDPNPWPKPGPVPGVPKPGPEPSPGYDPNNPNPWK